MLSAVIQLVLAAIVMLPPGAYRTLQWLARGTCSECSAATGNCEKQISRPRALADQVPAPARGRNWCQKTFTCEKPLQGKSLDGTEAAPDWLVAVENPDPRPCASTLRCSSAMMTHGSSRAALLALHELLI
jgi:hypothetical protein